MSEKYLNKYRISSARLEHWDYGNNAAYFITICTQNRKHFFGEIYNGKMQLTAMGKIVENEWIKTPNIRPDMNLKLGVFVVMPNHFHGILIIGKNKYNSATGVAPPYKNKFGPQSKNLGSVIRGFKSSVTTQVKKMMVETPRIVETPCMASLHGPADFAWQPRFHDHIIRDAESFVRIQNYIINNPFNWKEDKFNRPTSCDD